MKKPPRREKPEGEKQKTPSGSQGPFSDDAG
jgi:hypothetical protein